MSLRLYLDDCSYSRELTAKLRDAGHEVLIPIDAGTYGVSDRLHIERAIVERRLLITHNCRDFAQLHRELIRHPGIVGIYRDNDASRDMSYDEIVAALQRLEESGTPLENAFHVLNAWR